MGLASKRDTGCRRRSLSSDEVFEDGGIYKAWECRLEGK